MRVALTGLTHADYVREVSSGAGNNWAKATQSLIGGTGIDTLLLQL